MIEVDEKHLRELARLAKTVARQLRENGGWGRTPKFYEPSKRLVQRIQQLLIPAQKPSNAPTTARTDAEVVAMLEDLLREASATTLVARDLAEERGYTLTGGVVRKKPKAKPKRHALARRRIQQLLLIGKRR